MLSEKNLLGWLGFKDGLFSLCCRLQEPLLLLTNLIILSSFVNVLLDHLAKWGNMFLSWSIIAERISARLWIGDLFLQCMCVRMCLSRSGMSICTHCWHSRSRARSETHVHWWWRSRTGKNGTSWQIMEDVEDSVAGLRQCTCFAKLSAEHSRRLATLREWKQRSQCTKEAKKARREPDKVQKKKNTLWRVFTSQIHVVESLHKPDFTLLCSIQP